MKPKQLANVLFKVLGFSVCLHAIPSLVEGIAIFLVRQDESGWHFAEVQFVSYGIGAAVQLIVGIAIITMSQKISAWLIKSDDE